MLFSVGVLVAVTLQCLLHVLFCFIEINITCVHCSFCARFAGNVYCFSLSMLFTNDCWKNGRYLEVNEIEMRDWSSEIWSSENRREKSYHVIFVFFSEL